MQEHRNPLCAVIGKSLLSASLLLCSTAVMAQSQKTGVITDSNGEPLVGVSVLEQGTQNGVTTDANGRYRITTTKPNAKLKISYLGFDDQVITPGQSVKMTETDNELNELVVVGYGTMRRKDVTSSITTVTAKDLNTGVFTDPAQMLQGKVPGLVVTSTGDPSGTPTITLRGASTLRTDGGAAEPYYVIDGIPGVDISMVAADDIESIDVLRDASATAIYGSKAANGVIMITTKSGHLNQDRVNVTYNGYAAFESVLKTLDMASAGDIRGYVQRNNIDYAYDQGGNTDWQDEVLRTGISHNHNIGINGGGKKSTYMASVNYMNHEGIVRGTKMNRLNFRSLLTSKVLKDHLDISIGFNAMYGEHHGVPFGNEGGSVLDAMNYFNPTIPVRNADGSWTQGSGSANYNPLSLIHEDRSEFEWKRWQFIGKGTLHIIKGLDWSFNYQYGNRQRTFSRYDTHNSQLPGYSALYGRANRSTNKGHDQTFETFGNYNLTINDVHRIGIMAGYSWEERVDDDGFGLTVHNFFDDELGWKQLSYAGVIDGMPAVESGTEETIRNISFYGRASYSYAGRYMVQATLRRDGSSVFGKDHRWGTFPSFSVAWNITEESFAESLKKTLRLDNLKLRVGYGVSGNALGFGAYSAVSTYGSTGSVTTINGNSYATLQATKLANPDLKWESTKMVNVGIDYAFLNGRINGSLEFYHKVTDDLIWDYPVSSFIYPYATIKANVGKIANTGVEFSVNAIAVKTKDFQWQTMLNLAHNKNEVKRLTNAKYPAATFTEGDPMVAGVSSQGYTQIITEGEPLGTFYTYEFAGYNDNGKATYYVHDEATGQRTGEVTDAPTAKDRAKTGCAQPDLTLGWNNTLTYKNWSLTAFFTGVFGNDIYNGMRAHYTAPDFFASGKNVLKEFIYDRPYTDNTSNVPSDRFIENGSYFRFQSCTLGYTFHKLDGWLSSLQLYCTVNNIFTITGYKGLDPEVNLGGIDPGVDYRWKVYPHTRTVMLGAKISF